MPPQFGMVIGTFAAVPYVHLQLEIARQLYPEVPLLIHDDTSAQAPALQTLARQYGAEFTSTTRRQAHNLGDLLVYPTGLQWANDRGIDLLVKVSRRWVWQVDWRPSLARLAQETDADTFSNHTLSYDFGFRTECLALRVNRWVRSDFTQDVAAQVAEQREVFVEGYLHRWAISLSDAGSERWAAWRAAHPIPDERRGYAPWELMGNCRTQRNPNRLWHDANSADDYAALSEKLGLPWAKSDFADPNQGEGNGLRTPEEHVSGAALPSLLRSLGDHLVGAEIGVLKGDTSRHILTCPNVAHLYGIDPFVSYQDWWGVVEQTELDVSRHEVVTQLVGNPRFTLLQKTSEAAEHEIGQLDFVFVDGDHAYEQVRRDLRGYWVKLRPGGLCSGHDYRALADVKRAVDEFAAEVGAVVQEAVNDVWWFQKTSTP